MPFEFFDPKAETSIREGHLPHWYQPGVTYFVTFRTDDSIPVAVAKAWRGQREDWLRRHGVAAPRTDGKLDLEGLPRDVQHEFHDRFSRKYLDALDRGHGECLLRRPELAQIVAESLWHFDGERYRLGDFVIMPNHVHLLVCLLGATEVESQCRSWKKFAGTEINRRLSRKGRFWQEESFDHLVRSPEQFVAIRRYIAENPAAAKLGEGDFLHWRRAEQEK
jgi:putative transposase